MALAYQTSNYGKPAMATSRAARPQGCPYDSLNVGLPGPPTVGTLPRPDDAYLDSVTRRAQYCDGGAGGTDMFRLDAGCWSHRRGCWRLQPMVEVDATTTGGPPGTDGPRRPGRPPRLDRPRPGRGSGGVAGAVAKKCKKGTKKKGKKCVKKKKK